MPEKSGRKYYRVNADRTKNPPGLVIENEAMISPNERGMFIRPSPRVRGFWPMQERPRLRYIKSKGRYPQEVDCLLSDSWIINERAKTIFEDVDPTAFEFVECDVILKDGSFHEKLYMCDVIRVIDAIDITKTKTIPSNMPNLKFIFTGSEKIYFIPEKVGDAKIFRMYQQWSMIICDDRFRDACRKAKIQNMRYMPAA